MPRSSSPCRLTTFFSPWRLLLLLLVLTTPVAAFHPRLPRLTTFFSPWRLLLLLVLTMPVAAFHPRLPHMPSAARTAATPTTSPSSRSLTIGTPRLAHGIESGPIVALLKGPDDMYESAVKLGTHKAEEPAPIMFLLAIQAGLQVGIGAAMAVATMAGLPGIHASDPGLGKLIYAFCGLPCGLLMTATTGTMLFTGNTALVSVAWMEKRIKLRQLLKTWILSYTGNLLGAAMLAALCTYAGVFKSTAASIASVAAYKSALPFGVAVARGVLCNWLVTTAVWIAQGAADLASKALVIVMIITIFSALGFEHSVANMFIGPFAALNGGPRFLTFFLKNLVPVTIGNMIAGFILLAFSNYMTYGSGSKRWRGKNFRGKGFGKPEQ